MLYTSDDHEIPSKPAEKLTEQQRKKQEDRDPKDTEKFPGGYVVPKADLVPADVNDTTTNCMGVVFDMGESNIDPMASTQILASNYTLVNIQKKTATNQTGTVEAGARGKAQVCDIMHWGRKDAIAHVALIVEVDAAGEPTMTWGKDGDEGELRGIPPDEYGTDWFVDHRNDNLDPGTQAEVDQLRTDYDAAKAAYDNDKTEVKRRAAHKAAYLMCRRKNALKRK